MSVPKDYEEFLKLLNSEKVKYLIVGAYALGYYGTPRFTNDIDIFLECSKNNSVRILSVLEKFGFGEIKISSEVFQKKDQVIQLGYPPLRIDLITGIDGVTFKTAWRNRMSGKFGKQKVWYISQVDFKRNKRASGRLKDEYDLTLLDK